MGNAGPQFGRSNIFAEEMRDISMANPDGSRNLPSPQRRFPLWARLLIVGFLIGGLSGVAYLSVQAPEALRSDIGGYLLVFSIVICGIVGLLAAGCAIGAIQLVPKRRRGRMVEIASAGLGGAAGAVAGYFAFFGDASDIRPEYVAPGAGVLAFLIFASALALYRAPARRSRGK